ncbi:tol protein [Pyrenophora tritici-repentis Pt-1C-BFP]|uniref:Tol protein n=1 Tax=Pyrenophora tritici-repentis (strain Pt-1C-BFP) TaxID=426418 RepID=B2VT59_PYRTR|nr:tol protein [Pyrenophora tritici-repentis Pt-1C-BFP]EDU41333.1 tol protein [Pyrenophora tritici-repentis Pt-1C-BFP]
MYCHISATAAAKSPVGFFTESNTMPYTVFPVDVQRQGLTFPCYGIPENFRNQLNNEPLMKRGWVLQERLLSPRSIYFGSQLSWECTEIYTNELFPDGMPYELQPTWGYDTPYKLRRLLDTDQFKEGNFELVDYSFGRDRDQFTLYKRWAELVQSYSDCKLTFESDVLPAISRHNPMEQVTGGYFHLSGYMRPHSGKDRRPRSKDVPFISDWYDTHMNQSPELLQQGRYLLSSKYDDPLSFSMDNQTSFHTGYVRGLILEAVSDEQEEISLYPEFDDFDFDNLERQVITII